MMPGWWRPRGHETLAGVVNQLPASPPKGSDNCTGGSRIATAAAAVAAATAAELQRR